VTTLRLIRDHGNGYYTRDGYTVRRNPDDRYEWIVRAPQGNIGSTLTLADARERITTHRAR
jgi:hypothetical protein